MATEMLRGHIGDGVTTKLIRMNQKLYRMRVLTKDFL